MYRGSVLYKGGSIASYKRFELRGSAEQRRGGFYFYKNGSVQQYSNNIPYSYHRGHIQYSEGILVYSGILDLYQRNGTEIGHPYRDQYPKTESNRFQMILPTPCGYINVYKRM